MKLKFPVSMAAFAVAAATLSGMTVLAVEAPKPISISGAEAVGDGRVVEADGIGKNGETFFAVLEDNHTVSGNGPDHKMHCLGILQGTAGIIAEHLNFCVETDPDGDQVLWKLSFPTRRARGRRNMCVRRWTARANTPASR